MNSLASELCLISACSRLNWIYCYFIYLFFKPFEICIFKVKIVLPYFEGIFVQNTGNWYYLAGLTLQLNHFSSFFFFFLVQNVITAMVFIQIMPMIHNMLNTALSVKSSPQAFPASKNHALVNPHQLIHSKRCQHHQCSSYLLKVSKYICFNHLACAILWL